VSHHEKCSSSELSPMTTVTKAMSPFTRTQHKITPHGIPCGVVPTSYWWLWNGKTCAKYVRRKCKRCYETEIA
jgi:hypothetical protein